MWIALDLRRANYQILLITYRKFTVKNVKMKTVNENAILSSLKIIDYTTSIENVIKDDETSKRINEKISKLVSVLQG